MNAIGYVRLSIKDQSQYSLGYQEKSIADYCEKNGVELLEVFSDNGKSSYTFDRPDYIALEDFIKQRKGKIQFLVVMDHDRFSRNLSEALAKIENLEKKYGIKVLATNEALDIDTEDPNVFMQRAFKYLMANQELFSIRKRIKMGVRHAIENGRFINKAPFAYINAKEDGGKSTIKIDPDKAIIIRKIFSDYIDGKMPYIIHKEVKEMGFPAKGNSAIVRVLSNCVYAGLIKVPAEKNSAGRYVKGKHQGIIDENDYWLVQKMLENKRPSKTQPHEDSPLRGILKCPCGLSMTSGWSKGKKKYYLYYRCTKHHSINISAVKLHEEWNEILTLLSFSKEQIQYITDNSKKLIQAKLQSNVEKVAENRSALKEIEHKIQRLEEKMMNDEIESSTYKKWFSKYSGEKGYLLSEIKKLNAGDPKRFASILKLLPELISIPAIFEKANIIDQHSLIREVFKHDIIYSEGACRTLSINPMFAHNVLKFKEKGLLFLEQPSSKMGAIPIRTRGGNRTRT
ncbi:recombinase family protein, partial [Pedobacter suwonensis]|uniref:recombinase family protein n=3 Tax=Pedobacter suwonensis TaxID=332999 RepID=UPI003CFF4818